MIGDLDGTSIVRQTLVAWMKPTARWGKLMGGLGERARGASQKQNRSFVDREVQCRQTLLRFAGAPAAEPLGWNLIRRRIRCRSRRGRGVRRDADNIRPTSRAAVAEGPGVPQSRPLRAEKAGGLAIVPGRTCCAELICVAGGGNSAADIGSDRRQRFGVADGILAARNAAFYVGGARTR